MTSPHDDEQRPPTWAAPGSSGAPAPGRDGASETGTPVPGAPAPDAPLRGVTPPGAPLPGVTYPATSPTTSPGTSPGTGQATPPGLSTNPTGGGQDGSSAAGSAPGATGWGQPPTAPPPAQAAPGWGPSPVPPPGNGPGWGTPPGQAPAGWGPVPPPGQAPAGWGPTPPPSQGPGGWGQPALPPGGWRPPALQPGIIPLRPLGLGELLDGAFRAVRANPRVMFGLSAIVVTVAVLIQAVLQWYLQGLIAPQVADALGDIDPSGDLGLVDSVGTSIGQLLTAPLVSIATTVLSGLLIVSVSRSVLGEKVALGEVLRSWRVWLVLGFTVLLTVAELLVFAAWVALIVWFAAQSWVAAAVLVGLLGGALLVVGAVWVTGRTLLVSPALMLEGKGFRPTVARAWRLTRGSFWRLFGIYLLVNIIVLVIAQIVTFPAGIIAGFVFQDPLLTSFGSLAVVSVAQVVALTLSTVFVSSVVALLYIDVRMRREGLDIELARAAESRAAEAGSWH